MAPDNSVLRTFDGIIDEARLSNTAYSADWVAVQYASTTNAFVSFGTEETAPAIGGVTTNNTDTDGDFLSASIVSGPSNAAAFTFNVDGTFTYTPDLDFFGTDSVTYKVNDGTSDSNTATVTITVNPVNDAAAISGDISYTGNEGDVVADDLDATDVDGLTDTTYFTISAQGSSGTAVIDAGDRGLDLHAHRPELVWQRCLYRHGNRRSGWHDGPGGEHHPR